MLLVMERYHLSSGISLFLAYFLAINYKDRDKWITMRKLKLGHVSFGIRFFYIPVSIYQEIFNLLI